jgi:hypothetical protein
MQKTVHKRLSGSVRPVGTLKNTVHMGLFGKLTAAGSLALERRREFSETNKLANAIIIFLSIASLFIAILPMDLLGVILGVVLSVANYFLTPYAVIRVREIDRWHPK